MLRSLIQHNAFQIRRKQFSFPAEQCDNEKINGATQLLKRIFPRGNTIACRTFLNNSFQLASAIIAQNQYSFRHR